MFGFYLIIILSFSYLCQASSNHFYIEKKEQTSEKEEKLFMQVIGALYQSNMHDFLNFEKLNLIKKNDRFFVAHIVDGLQANYGPKNFKEVDNFLYYKKIELKIKDHDISLKRHTNFYIIGYEQIGFFIIHEYEFSYYDRYCCYWSKEIPDIDEKLEEYDDVTLKEYLKKNFSVLIEFMNYPPLFVFNEKDKSIYLLDIGGKFEEHCTFYQINNNCIETVDIKIRDTFEKVLKQCEGLNVIIKILDTLLGHPDPRTEGTLQINARTRKDANVVVINTILRPWVALDQDLKLKAKSQINFLKKYYSKNKEKNKLYNNLLDAIQKAKVDLKKYYTIKFSFEAVDTYVEKNMDFIICSYLKFKN